MVMRFSALFAETVMLVASGTSPENVTSFPAAVLQSYQNLRRVELGEWPGCLRWGQPNRGRGLVPMCRRKSLYRRCKSCMSQHHKRGDDLPRRRNHRQPSGCPWHLFRPSRTGSRESSALYRVPPCGIRQCSTRLLQRPTRAQRRFARHQVRHGCGESRRPRGLPNWPTRARVSA